MNSEITIRPYADGDAAAFHDLNLRWLTAFFAVEAKDEAKLSDPQAYILAPGGAIFVADRAGKTIGCVALLAMGAGADEVAKMAVDPDAQGQGIGRSLLTAAVQWAQAQGARRLYLESNARIGPALRLYESAGFRHLAEKERPVSPYARADVFMEFVFMELRLAEEAARETPEA